MVILRELPHPIKVSRFQHLPDAVQEFLLSDKKRDDLINLVTYQGLPEDTWVKLNEILWGLFLRELGIQMLEQGISEHLSIDGQKAKDIGQIMRKTILVPYLDMLSASTPKQGNNPPPPQGNVVNLKARD